MPLSGSVTEDRNRVQSIFVLGNVRTVRGRVRLDRNEERKRGQATFRESKRESKDRR